MGSWVWDIGLRVMPGMHTSKQVYAFGGWVRDIRLRVAPKMRTPESGLGLGYRVEGCAWNRYTDIAASGDST